jgi:arylsulfatase A-like enzyme
VLLISIDTLRADHLGAYGYARTTSPQIDALAADGTLFEEAYTFWPKTRASFVMMLTGRRPSQNGYSHQHPVLLDFNPTLASVLHEAGYRTAAIVDNANVAKALGYAKGFDSYREIWKEPDLQGEWAGTLAITAGGVEFLKQAAPEHPFFLWLHYVNPHAPYTPPSPYDAAFVDGNTEAGPKLRVMPGFHGGVPRPLYVPGHRRLAYYVAQYDGEVAGVDAQVGVLRDALNGAGLASRTLVVLVSDHGESLGEHDYYFDHGEDLFDPSLRVPLVVVAPGGRRGHRSRVLASTLDVMPTVLDAVKLKFPPDLAGTSLLSVLGGGPGPKRDRLFAQNDHDMLASFDARTKLVTTFSEQGTRYVLYDRVSDRGERHDVSRERPEELRVARRELERFLEIADREAAVSSRLLKGAPSGGTIDKADCERLKALGYVQVCAP